MVQRLFLDGIDLQSRGMRVTQAVEFSALVHANEAKSGLPFPDVAVPRAKIAVRFAARLRLPPTGFMQLRGFLKNLKVLQGSRPSR
jgi:hypothetical protein